MQRDADAEQRRGQPVGERERVLERCVRADVGDVPPVVPQRDREHHQPELVPLVGSAREHGRAADAAAAVADEMSEPGAHRLADEMLLHDAELARLPERPDLLQERIDHIASFIVNRNMTSTFPARVGP